MVLQDGVTDKRILNNFKTLEKRLLEKHNNKYSYSKAVFVKSTNKMIIICPIHGEFEQAPTEHLKGAGCPKCALEYTASKRRRTTENFIQEAKQVHGDKYDYSKTTYVNSATKVTITCPIHGDFEQLPGAHTVNRYGCIKCGREVRSLKISSNTADFIAKARKVHNDIYTYENTEYINSTSKVYIRCRTHGYFHMRPNDHLNGQCCPLCTGSRGFQKTLPAYLYYLKITTDDDKVVYKIGITNNSVEQRYGITDLKKIEVLNIVKYDVGLDAYNEEQRILKQYSSYKYVGIDILKDGNTELFTEDILKDYDGFK